MSVEQNETRRAGIYQHIRGMQVLLLALIALSLSGCQVIEGIFKAGLWVGVLTVLVVVALAGWAVSKLRR